MQPINIVTIGPYRVNTHGCLACRRALALLALRYPVQSCELLITTSGRVLCSVQHPSWMNVLTSTLPVGYKQHHILGNMKNVCA
jgi:hypothetical protein